MHRTTTGHFQAILKVLSEPWYDTDLSTWDKHHAYLEAARLLGKLNKDQLTEIASKASAMVEERKEAYEKAAK